MSLEKLEKLTELTASFKEAVEKRVENTSGLQEKIISSLSSDEIEELTEQAMGLVMGGLGAALGGVDKEFLQENIKAVEKVAEISSKFISNNDLAQDLPKELANEESIKALEDNGAKTVAKIAKHKLSGMKK